MAGPGFRAQVANPYGVQIGPDGALYICDIDNHRVRRLDLKSGEISTVAGNGQEGYSGDGGQALEASLNQPYEVRFDKSRQHVLCRNAQPPSPACRCQDQDHLYGGRHGRGRLLR